jgi:hypothetical protein
MNIKRSMPGAPPCERTPEFAQLRTSGAVAPDRVTDNPVTARCFTGPLPQGHTLFRRKRRSRNSEQWNALTLERSGSAALKRRRKKRKAGHRLWKLKATDPIHQVLESACYEVLTLSATGALLYSAAMFLRPG